MASDFDSCDRAVNAVRSQWQQSIAQATVGSADDATDLPVKVTITPPAYTHMSVYRGLLPDQGLVGVAGTTVKWDVTSNRPLASGLVSVTYADGEKQEIELKPLDSESESYHVEGSYTLTRSVNSSCR